MTGEIRPSLRLRLWVELVLLFGATPFLIAVFLPASTMFPALFLLTAVGAWLLHRTPGFNWAELVRGGVDWRPVAAFMAATAAVALAVSAATGGGAPFGFVADNPGLMALILVAYPVLSALPQEVIFRPLWFRRYGAVLPGGVAGLVLNAVAFSFAHLMYWSWIVAAMTLAGGLAFAWAYAVRGSFPLAVVLHAVAGVIVFAAGLGMFFYTGSVVRPY